MAGLSVCMLLLLCIGLASTLAVSATMYRGPYDTPLAAHVFIVTNVVALVMFALCTVWTATRAGRARFFRRMPRRVATGRTLFVLLPLAVLLALAGGAVLGPLSILVGVVLAGNWITLVHCFAADLLNRSTIRRRYRTFWSRLLVCGPVLIIAWSAIAIVTMGSAKSERYLGRSIGAAVGVLRSLDEKAIWVQSTCYICLAAGCLLAAAHSFALHKRLTQLLQQAPAGSAASE
jgi:hypothetical protein